MNEVQPVCVECDESFEDEASAEEHAKEVHDTTFYDVIETRPVPEGLERWSG